MLNQSKLDTSIIKSQMQLQAPVGVKKDFNAAYNDLKKQIITKEISGEGADPLSKLALPEQSIQDFIKVSIPITDRLKKFLSTIEQRY